MDVLFCICDNCKEEKEVYSCDTCRNEITWGGRKCNKNICSNCCIPCERCDGKFGMEKINMCSYCCNICNKCKKNICYRCEEKYGRCEDCWYKSPLCDACEDVEADYKCDLCFKEVCYEHKKICYNCGTKCMDCHANYYKASCKDCKDDLSPEDIEWSDYISYTDNTYNTDDNIDDSA